MNPVLRYLELLYRELRNQAGRLAMIAVSVTLGVFTLSIFFAFGQGFSRFYRQVERDMPGSNQLRFSTEYWKADGEWLQVPGASTPLPLDLHEQMEEFLGEPVNLRTSQPLAPDGRPVATQKSLFTEISFAGAEGEEVENGSAASSAGDGEAEGPGAPDGTMESEAEAAELPGEDISETLPELEPEPPDQLSTRMVAGIWRDYNLRQGRTREPEIGRLPEVGERELLMIYPREGQRWRVRDQPMERFLGAEVTLRVPYVNIPDLRLFNHPELLPPQGEWIRREQFEFEIVGVSEATDTDAEPSFVPDFTRPADFPSVDLYMSESTMADLVEATVPQLLARQMPPDALIGEDNLQPFFVSLVEMQARGYLSEVDLAPLTEVYPEWRDYADFRVSGGDQGERERLGSWHEPWLRAEEGTLAKLTTAERIERPQGPDAQYEWQRWMPVSAAVQVGNLYEVSRLSLWLERDFNYRVFTIFDRFKPMRRLGLVVRTLTTGVGIVAMIISVLGITAVLVMAVAERTRQIGISRAVGATRRDILLIYLGQAAVVGLVSLVPGFLLARWAGDMVDRYMNLLMANSEEFRDFLFGQDSLDVFQMDGELFLVVAGVTLVACLIAALFPALRAANLEAVDALRHE